MDTGMTNDSRGQYSQPAALVQVMPDRARPPLGPVLRLAAILLSASALGVATTIPGFIQAAIAVSVGAAAFVLTIQNPRHSILSLIVWLTSFGMVRRLLLGEASALGEDPLLLVAPTIVAVLLALAVRRGALRNRGRLTTSVLLLCGLIGAGALNPLQGSLTAGLAGLLFILVPPLWFWIGRALVDDALFLWILRLIGVLAVVAALYGLFQVYQGFPPWDERWIETSGLGSLRVGDSFRQFASFASPGEYVGFLAIGFVVWALRLRRSSAAYVTLAVLGLLGWALAVASVRGALLVLPVALGIMYATARGFGTARTLLFGLAGLVVVSIGVSFLGTSPLSDTRTRALIDRQVTGLSNPFDPSVSTLPIHFELVLNGFEQALRNPIGRGLGTITSAGSRFGSESLATETDPSNMAVALGLPGFLAYAVIVILGFRRALHRARSSRDYLHLAALGILLVTALQWLNGGAYAIAPLPWLVLGWLDRPTPPAPQRTNQDATRAEHTSS